MVLEVEFRPLLFDVFICIMRPDAEAPLLAADEVSVEVGDAEVVDAIPLRLPALANAEAQVHPCPGRFSPRRELPKIGTTSPEARPAVPAPPRQGFILRPRPS